MACFKLKKILWKLKKNFQVSVFCSFLPPYSSTGIILTNRYVPEISYCSLLSSAGQVERWKMIQGKSKPQKAYTEWYLYFTRASGAKSPKSILVRHFPDNRRLIQLPCRNSSTAASPEQTPLWRQEHHVTAGRSTRGACSWQRNRAVWGWTHTVYIPAWLDSAD